MINPHLPHTPENTLSGKFQTMRGAAGKAMLVYLFSGSLGAAVVAYLVFRGMGC